MGIYVDTSALAKLYHQEVGSAEVDRLALESAGACFVSRLGVLELNSVFAGKVRTGFISVSESQLLWRRFRGDLRRRRFRAVSLRVRHYEMAEQLLHAWGATHGLRTLDSLHLAVTLDLQQHQLIDSVVAADKVFCRVASLEGVPVIDPESSPGAVPIS